MKEGPCMIKGWGDMEAVLCPESWDPAAVCIIHGKARFIQGDLHGSSFTCYHY